MAPSRATLLHVRPLDSGARLKRLHRARTAQGLPRTLPCSDGGRGRLQARLRALLERPERVRALQEGVLQHQAHFLWDPELASGVYGNIERELAMRAVQRATGETISVF